MLVERGVPANLVETSPAIEVERLVCAYDGAPVIENLTLAIRRGAFVGVVGPSGAGKTTFLRALLGAVPRMAGSIRIFGEEISAGRVPRIGYVPQLETVDWNFPVTVREVVAMGLAVEGQRVFLARALVREPRLLLLDEPTTGVDIKTRHDVLHLLAELNHEGVTVVLTTHDLNSVAAHLPQVICLNRRLVAQGPPASIFTPSVLEATYGAEMVVVRQGELTVIADKLGVFRDITDQHSHPEGADHQHTMVGDQDHP